MYSKKFLALSAALLGGVLSTSAFATSVNAHAQVTDAVRFEAPVVAKVVSPTGLARRHEGATVMVTMTIEANGQPSHIRVRAQDANLNRSLTNAVSQWEFTPAKKNGVAVPSRVELPIEVTDAMGS